jgi:Cu/Ag efflux protein CusF
MKRKTAATVILVLVLSELVLAHGNQQHIMGTVTSISESSITVENGPKQTQTVAITDKTKFIQGDARATVKDLKVGDRVVIHAEKQGEKLTATTIRFQH